MRQEVDELLRMGPMPDEGSAEQDQVDRYAELIDGIARPATDDEARALVSIFGHDDFFGVAWSLLHLIETAPHWPLPDCLRDPQNDWIRLLRDRSEERLGGTSDLP